MKRPAALLACAVAAAAARASTPMDADVPEGQITKIACECVDPAETCNVFAGTNEDPAKVKPKGPYHYKLYVPRGYHGDTERRYPCMFVASPGGNAGMTALGERFKRDRWVVVMLVESRNGTPDWFYNFTAAHDDVVKRVRLLDGYKFCTGMSGGARCVATYSTFRDGFAGVFLQAAGFSGQRSKFVDPLSRMALYATFGSKDMNLYETDEFYRQFPPSSQYTMEVFEGGHGWAPGPSAERALDWIEHKVFVESVTTGKHVTEASRWYCESQLARLAVAKGAFDRYEIMERFCGAASRAKDAKVAAAAAGFRTKMPELARDAGVAKEVAARNALGAVAGPLREFRALMVKKRPRYKKRQMDDAEYAALGRIASVYQGVVTRWPDAKAGRLAAVRATSLKLEFKDGPLKSACASLRAAVAGNAWPEVARRALAVKAWADPGSAEAREAEGALERADVVGAKLFERLAGGSNAGRLRAFVDDWSACPCANKARVRCVELGQKELASALARSGFSRATTLRKMLDDWEAFPSVRGRVLDAYDQEAKIALDKAAAIPSQPRRERALKGILAKWKPAPSALKAAALLDDIARGRLEVIARTTSALKRKSMLRSFIRSYDGTAAAGEAKRMLKEMAEEEARKALDKIKKAYRGARLKGKLKLFVRRYDGTRAAAEAASLLKQ